MTDEKLGKFKEDKVGLTRAKKKQPDRVHV